MFWSEKIECSAEIILPTAQGPILRISLSGSYFDGIGCRLGDSLTQTLRKHQPAGVILDFLHFRYRAGNDFVWIAQVFIRGDPGTKPVVRPCAIVAVGRTAKSLMSLLVPAKFLDTFDVRFFEDVDVAAGYLRDRLQLPADAY